MACPCSLVVYFPAAVYKSVAAAEVLPKLLDAVPVPREEVLVVQFLRNGAVRVTFKTERVCDTVSESGIRYGEHQLRIAPVKPRHVLVHLRDCPIEVPNKVASKVLEAFGEVHKITASAHEGFPAILNGTRVIKMSLHKDIPSVLRVGGFDCVTGTGVSRYFVPSVARQVIAPSSAHSTASFVAARSRATWRVSAGMPGVPLSLRRPQVLLVLARPLLQHLLLLEFQWCPWTQLSSSAAIWLKRTAWTWTTALQTNLKLVPSAPDAPAPWVRPGPLYPRRIGIARWWESITVLPLLSRVSLLLRWPSLRRGHLRISSIPIVRSGRTNFHGRKSVP